MREKILVFLHPKNLTKLKFFILTFQNLEILKKPNLPPGKIHSSRITNLVNKIIQTVNTINFDQ